NRGEAKFQIPTAVGSDSAWYTATAINKAGRDTTRCRVNVEVDYVEPEPERKLIIPKGTYKAKEIAPPEVEVTGYPTPKVNWYLNGQLIRKSKRYRLHYDGIYYLEVTDIKSYDSGEVKVMADNNLGSAEHTVKLEIQQKEDFRTHLRRAPEAKTTEAAPEPGKIQFEVVKTEKAAEDSQKEVVMLKKTQRIVHEKATEESEELRSAPLEILKQLENTEVPETYSAEFECQVSREDAEGSWFFRDKMLSQSSKYVMMSRRGRHCLSVKDVKKEDQGKYSFKVGEFQTSASLKMKREYFDLVKNISNLNVPVTATERVHLVIDRQTHKILIENTTKDDLGAYSFVVPAQEISTSAKLFVQSRSIHNKLAESVLETKITAQDVSSVKWYHNDQLLSASDRIQMVAKGVKQRLVLNRTYASDEGNYKLIVGRAETSCRLTVQSKSI
uniref:Ig-like domain-containing protein n=1 Tax=Cynoglossus semilaevis TaxID=244447 RepID=A0A3P8WAZ7_CYNSE